jgi:hypothetical protein
MESVPSDPNGGSKTKFREVSPARKLRSDPGFPHTSLRELSHARPALLTVFSTTQLDHSITQSDFMPFTVLDMLSIFRKYLTSKFCL